MIAMIETLIARGLAYQAEDKSVYFRINKFPGLRKAGAFRSHELRSTGRVKSDEYEKEHIGDFALWKAWDEEDGDVRWEAVGTGPAGLAHRVQRDGDGAARRADRYSLRRRGQIFPHHEAEIAQTRRLHREKVRALLAALRAPPGRRPENVEVVRQFLHSARCADERIQRPRSSLRADARALSRAAQFHLGRNGRGAPGARTDR